MHCLFLVLVQENDLLTSQQGETDRELQRLHQQLEDQKQAAVRMAHDEGTALMRTQQESAQMQVPKLKTLTKTAHQTYARQITLSYITCTVTSPCLLKQTSSLPSLAAKPRSCLHYSTSYPCKTAHTNTQVMSMQHSKLQASMRAADARVVELENLLAETRSQLVRALQVNLQLAPHSHSHVSFYLYCIPLTQPQPQPKCFNPHMYTQTRATIHALAN